MVHAVRPDGRVIKLRLEADGIGQVAASADGRWVALSGSVQCRQHLAFWLIDLTRAAAGRTPWSQALAPGGGMSCATTSLHFEGADLAAGWMITGQTRPPGCPQRGGPVALSTRLPKAEFRPSDTAGRTPWVDHTCLAGVWSPADGEQLQLLAGPLDKGSRPMPSGYSLVRKRPAGHGEVVLAEDVAAVVVRPR
ncbi:hypothetical protein [Microlunatus parietis]|uniref:Uncharacterized protein n=1 Tax=Microlunatus parietis TaxID=682979 RepID=A0A7Y9I1W6_9ACTN|nr:hypothetical protein [Microlunatus parietis]NYE68722.1 hypothetical protein [Microlunatus parietis]